MEETAPKSKRGRRTVPLPALARTALRQPRPDIPADGYVLVQPSDKPYTGRVLLLRWQATLKRLGLPAIRLPDCRHTTSSLLANLGVDAATRQAILGHASPEMTERTHTHSLPGASVEAMRPLNAALEEMLRPSASPTEQSPTS